MDKKRTTWILKEWNKHFIQLSGKSLPPMTREEISSAMDWLRDHHYSKPEDCPWENCPNLRPACKLNICQIAVGMCRDF